MKVRTWDDARVFVARRGRTATGGGGRAMREDDDGRGRASRNPLGSPRSRAGVEGVARARARARTVW